MLRRGAVFALFSTLLGCTAPANLVFIEICGDVFVPADVDALRISILDEDYNEYKSGTLELLRCPEDVELELPQTTELEAPYGNVWVAVQGLQQGVEVVRSERRLLIEDGEPAQDVLVGLTRSCMRITCPKGLTCIDGVCEQAPWESDEEVCEGGPPSMGTGGGMATCGGTP